MLCFLIIFNIRAETSHCSPKRSMEALNSSLPYMYTKMMMHLQIQKKPPGLLLSIIITKMTAWASCYYLLLPFPLMSKNFSMHFLVIDALEQYKEISYQLPITELERMTDIYPQMATPEDFFCTISSVIHIMITSNSNSNSFSLTFLFFCSLPFLSVFCH